MNRVCQRNPLFHCFLSTDKVLLTCSFCGLQWMLQHSLFQRGSDLPASYNSQSLLWSISAVFPLYMGSGDRRHVFKLQNKYFMCGAISLAWLFSCGLYYTGLPRHGASLVHTLIILDFVLACSFYLIFPPWSVSLGCFISVLYYLFQEFRWD